MINEEKTNENTTNVKLYFVSICEKKNKTTTKLALKLISFVNTDKSEDYNFLQVLIMKFEKNSMLDDQLSQINFNFSFYIQLKISEY